jgi:chromosome segregation ATPase
MQETNYSDIVVAVQENSRAIQALNLAVQSNSHAIEALTGRAQATQLDVQTLQEDVKVLKEDVKILKEDVKILKEDVKDIRQEMREMRAENDLAHEEIKRHFDVVAEGLNSTIMFLAEQIREDRRERNSLVTRVDRLECNDSLTQMRLGVLERTLKLA